jgi:hypothetical protein
MISLWSFLLGGPGETEKTVDETLNFIDKNMGKNNMAYIMSGVRIYPGSEIYKQWQTGKLDKSGIIVHEESGDLFYHSPHIEAGRIREKIAEFRKGYPNIILGDETQSLFTALALTCARTLRFSKPYWRHIPLLNLLKRPHTLLKIRK